MPVRSLIRFKSCNGEGTIMAGAGPLEQPAASAEGSPVCSETVQSLGGARKRSGIFAADLTLAEVKELYAVQTFKFRDHSYDTRYR